MSYSQNDEQRHILDYFGTLRGRFLDCGAYDGRAMSNTLALAERGWGGVCIEPDPQAFEGLQRTHGDNRDIALVPAAIAFKSGKVPFHNSRSGGVSTLSDAHRDKWAGAATFETIEVLAMTVDELLDFHPGKYEFLSLDVEGMSADLLELFPLRDMGVELACVEHDGQQAHIMAYCQSHGLTRRIYESGENLIVGK